MIAGLAAVICFSLFMIFCVRHFFVQLLGIKLFLDGLVFLLSGLRTQDGSPLYGQTAAVLVSSLSAMVFFVLMAAGIQRFARSSGSNMEVKSD